MPHVPMTHDIDPKDTITDAIGDISGFQVFHNELIVAVYLRPEKTKGGIFLPEQHRDEDRFQSKVGLVVKMGPDAFVDNTGMWFNGGVEVKVGDWVWFRPSDGFNVTVNGTLCRALRDTSIRGVIDHPDRVW